MNSEAKQQEEIKMKAWIATSYGGPEVLTEAEIEKLRPSKGQVLIEVHYAALNPYDYKLRNGVAKMMTGRKFPKVFGGDFAGRVLVVDGKNTDLKVGQLVYGFANVFMKEQGSLAEYTAISPKYVRPVPPGLELIDAVAMTSAGLTALSGILECGDLRGKEVLVNGATGGVGHLATKFMVAKGASVTAVCSTKNIPTAEEMKVKAVIDYKKEEVLKPGESYDIIYDAAAKLAYAEAKGSLAPKGIFCTTEESPKAMLASLLSKFGRGKRMYLSGFKGSPAHFEAMEALVVNDGVRPNINHRFAFSEVKEAFRLLEEGGASGKIVIQVKQNDDSIGKQANGIA